MSDTLRCACGQTITIQGRLPGEALRCPACGLQVVLVSSGAHRASWEIWAANALRMALRYPLVVAGLAFVLLAGMLLALGVYAGGATEGDTMRSAETAEHTELAQEALVRDASDGTGPARRPPQVPVADSSVDDIDASSFEFLGNGEVAAVGDRAHYQFAHPGEIKAALQLTADNRRGNFFMSSATGHVTAVQLAGASADLSDADFAAFRALMHLRYLDLSQLEAGGVSGRGFVELSHLTNLQSLDLSGQLASNQTLKTIGTLHRLQALRLRGTNITDAGVAALTSLQKLRQLDLRETGLTIESLPHIGQLVRLEELYLTPTWESAAALPYFSRLHRLRDPLAVLGSVFAPAGAGDWVSGPSYDLSWAREFNYGTQPEHVLVTIVQDDSLQSCRKGWSGELLRHIQGMKQITELDLTDFYLVDDDLAYLSGLDQLKTLRIFGSPITGAGLKHLARLPQLEELSLKDTALQEADLELLLKFPRLRSVDASPSLISEEAGRRFVERHGHFRLTCGTAAAGQGLAGSITGPYRLEGSLVVDYDVFENRVVQGKRVSTIVSVKRLDGRATRP